MRRILGLVVAAGLVGAMLVLASPASAAPVCIDAPPFKPCAEASFDPSDQTFRLRWRMDCAEGSAPLCGSYSDSGKTTYGTGSNTFVCALECLGYITILHQEGYGTHEGVLFSYCLEPYSTCSGVIQGIMLDNPYLGHFAGVSVFALCSWDDDCVYVQAIGQVHEANLEQPRVVAESVVMQNGLVGCADYWAGCNVVWSWVEADESGSAYTTSAFAPGGSTGCPAGSAPCEMAYTGGNISRGRLTNGTGSRSHCATCPEVTSAVDVTRDGPSHAVRACPSRSECNSAGWSVNGDGLTATVDRNRNPCATARAGVDGVSVGAC